MTGPEWFYVGGCVAYWLLIPVVILLVWRWRNQPDRIAQMADFMERRLWMSAQRCARIIPSTLVGVVGGGFVVVPLSWGLVTGDIGLEAYPFRTGDRPVLFLGALGLALILVSGALAVSTALWRVPSILVYPFLRDGSADTGQSDGDVVE